MSLHNHTRFSIMDGLADIKDYVLKMHKFNKEYNGQWYPAIAVTEHGNFSSQLKVLDACSTKIKLDENDIERTIKPIYGIEIYHSLEDTSQDRRRNPDLRKKDYTLDDLPLEEKKQAYHMVLLAKNDIGYKNLIQISSHAGLNSYNSFKKMIYRTDIPFMQNRGKGIIALSACLGGYIPSLLKDGRYEEAKLEAIKYSNIFEHFYLEIQANDIPEQIIVNSHLVRMSKETGIPLVITCDSHYAEKEDREAHNILYSLANGDETKLYDENGKRKTIGIQCNVHLQTPLEIEQYCIDYDIPLSAMDNTVEIANMCNVDFTPKDKKGYMPSYKVPKGYTESSYLRKLASDGFFKKVQEKKIKDNLEERFKRLQYELDVIIKTGFPGYFLIVSDFVNKCRENNIIVGPGRGSAASSLLSYCLNITNIDPIKYNFIFERFLNPERASLPD